MGEVSLTEYWLNAASEKIDTPLYIKLIVEGKKGRIIEGKSSSYWSVVASFLSNAFVKSTSIGNPNIKAANSIMVPFLS